MVTNIQHNPQDMTGRLKAEQAERYAEEQRQAANSMAMVTEQAHKVREGVVDISGPDRVTYDDGTSNVEVKVPKVEMRVNTKLDNVTIGYGSDYSFEPGQRYRVTQDVYDYMERKNFVWH